MRRAETGVTGAPTGGHRRGTTGALRVVTAMAALLIGVPCFGHSAAVMLKGWLDAGSVANASGKIFSATCRFRVVSVA